MKVLIKNTLKDAKGKVKVTKGDIMPEAKAIKKGVSPRYYEVLHSSNTPYTRKEVEVIVRSYLRCDSRQSVMKEFFEVFPNSTHTPDSVMSTSCQLENIDNTKPSGGYHLTQLVVEVAISIAPERFV